ncbi:nucleotide sugar dehydrogenase [Glonium stellatum]|uniref:UDP-glucose 6-dehydrogenase n=1 Tax=Glonium stellatum TaxID=574774 RepID=A0A8E2ETZ8_9PEZI|nr:nucleotide sugar dehydrogenase [Glonium stellatum]
MWVTKAPETVKNICCVGAGYVGGPTAAVIAFQNPSIQVSVVDLDEARIRKWNSRHLPVHEPGLIEVVRVSRDGTKATEIALGNENEKVFLPSREPNLRFSTNVSECVAAADVVFVSVNTPTKSSGIGAGAATNLVALESAMTSVAQAAKPGAIIVEKSTVPCGTARTIREILTLYRPGVPFEILSNPEFLAEGTAIKDLLYPDRILIGSSQTPAGLAAAAALKEVYATWVNPSKIVTVNLWSSELAKLVANAMLAQRISSINTISAICDQTGADIDEVSKAIGLDQRLGSKFLKAGLGFGGSCFKKDILSLVYLARSLHLSEVGDYWMSVLSINEFQRDRFVNKVVSKLNGALVGKKIAILGYTFKQDTNDTRESPAIEVIKTLLAERPAEIAIFDPGCSPTEVRREINRNVSSDAIPLKPQGPVEAYSNSYDACFESSAVLILTPWDQFRCPALAQKDSAFRKSNDQNLENPQAFLKPVLSEMDIVTLAEYQRAKSTSHIMTVTSDPLSRLFDQAECTLDCVYCENARQADSVKVSESVDWARIAYNMKEPKWVFDGRNIVDAKEMGGLGFRVESMGKAGTRSPRGPYLEYSFR